MPTDSSHPLVSVIIVCHNDWPHLDLAVHSALGQSRQPVEVIVVDNASTDGTPGYLQEKFGDRIRYVRQENKGAAGGRNTGFQLARGKYIQLLDGDDFLAPNKLEVQVEYLEKHPEVDIAYGDFRTFRSTPDVPAESLYDCDSEDWPDIKLLLMGRCPGPPIMFLFRRSVIERVGPQAEDMYYEDYEWWVRCAFAGCQFRRTPNAFAFYRRRAGQKSEKMTHAALAELEVLRRARDYIHEEPYRSHLCEKLAKLEYAFANYHLWKGDRKEARAFFDRAMQSAPAHLRFAQASLVRSLTKVPFGSSAYRWVRTMRRLPPPFQAPFRSIKPAVA